MLHLLVAGVACIVSLRADEARWQPTEIDNGCLVRDALPQPDEKVTWSGACIDGKASGRRTCLEGHASFGQ